MTKEQILNEANAMEQELIEHRRHIHCNPETGFALTKTKAYVRKVLENFGIHPEECGRCGLMADLGKPGGKVLLLRADMDALPIREEADVEFASQNGNMHACGHDLHTVMLLGAAKLLKTHESELNGIVRLMFQPSEETFEGAKDMIQSGVLREPKVDSAMMIHVTAGIPLPAGTVIVSAPGVSAPAADYFKIHVQGKGCHGSAPQNGIDPLTAAAHILIALQEIQARELAASDEAVMTIGTFHAGETENVIPNTVTMGGTIRTYDETTRRYLKERIAAISQGIASAFRATAEVSFGTGCPTLVNDAELCKTVTGILKDLLGPSGALSTEELNPGGKPSRGGGSEDFAYVSQEVPSLMLALAAGEPEKGYSYPQHHPKVAFDESVLPVGSAVFAYTAMQYLR